MHKIYTRHRIRIPKIKINPELNRNFKKNKKMRIIIIVLLIAIITAKTILNAITPIFNTLCEERTKSIATIISNEEATNVMREHTYEDLFTIEKDSNGNITMIKSNVFTINEIISDVANNIQEQLDKKGKDNISIALGSFTGIKFLSGLGPDIKITISPVGNVETDLRSEFTAQGINQTLHRIYLQVKCEVSIVTPFESITKEIYNQVLLAENVIVGNIPNTYYNLEGINSNSEALEVVE